MADDDDEDEDIADATQGGGQQQDVNPYAKYVGAAQAQQPDGNPYAKYVSGQQQPEPDANPYAKYVGGQQQQQQQQPKAESPFWTTLRQAAHGALPMLAGAASGVATGAGYGAAAGTLGLPGPGTLAGTIIGGGLGLVTGAAGGYAASTAQEAGAKALGFDDSQQLAANAAANPWSSAIGAAAPAALPFGVGGKAVGLGARALYGAVAGGAEAGSEYAGGQDLDPRAIGLSALTGGALAQPRGFLAPAEAAGARLGTRLGEQFHGTPGSKGAAGTAEAQTTPVGGAPVEPGAAAATPEATAPAGDRGGPEDYGKAEEPPAEPAPTEQGATNTDPALDAAIRAKMEPEGGPAGEPAAAPRPMAPEGAPPEPLPGPQVAAEPVALASATPAIRKLGDIEIAKNPDGPGYVVRRGDDVLSEHDTLRQANAKMVKQANAASPADKALPSFYEQQKAQAQAQFAKEAVRRVGDIAIVKNPDGPGYVVMRGDDILSQHNNIGQAHLGLNRAVKQANLPLPPDEAFAPAPAAPAAPAPSVQSPAVAVEKGPPRGPGAKDEQLYSLLEYLAHNGGLQRDIPELKDIFGGKNRLIPGFGNLLRKNGMSLDQAWLKATREGRYLNDASDFEGRVAKTTTSDLLDLIDKEARGARQYRVGSEGTTTAGERGRAAELNRVAIQRAVDGFSEDAGLGALDPKIYDRTVEIMEKEGVSSPDMALEQAIMEGANQYEKANKYRQDAAGHIEGWDVDDTAAARGGGAGVHEASAGPDAAGAPIPSDAGEVPRGTVEMGAEGKPQGVIPGAERIGEGELAQRRADQRLRPTAPQRPADEGLFGDTHLQENLFTGGRDELMRQRLDAAEAAPSPAAHLRETAAMYRERGQEGRARQFERAADAFERSQQQQQQQQQRQQPPRQPPGGPPKPPTVGQAAAAGGGKLPPGPTSMAYAPPQNRSNLSKLWRSMKLLVGSDIGPYGRQAENIIRGAYGRAKRVFEQTMNLLNPHMETVRNMGPMDRAALNNRVEGGKDFPNWQPTPDQQRIIDVYKPAMDLWKDQFSKLDRTAQMKFVKDYLAHMYKNPAQASEFFSQFGKRGGAGSTKGRTHATYEDAKKAGLEPLTDNPIEIATRYGLSMTNFIASNDALERAVETGVVGYFSSGKSVGATGSPEPHQVGGPPPGWKKLNAPPKGPFLEAYAPEDFADKYNAFYSQGLRGVHAPIYDALRSANAGWTMMELGLNAYHFFTMANEAIISDVKRGLDQLFTGQFKEGAKTIAGAPLAPGTRYIEGKRFQREYLDPNSTNPIASIMAEANARPVGRGHAYDILGSAGDENISRGSFIKNFDKDKINSQLKQAWDDVKDDWGLADSVGKQALFPFKQASRVLQTVGAPLFDKYIPALKAGAMHSQMADWLAANPHIDINTPAGRQAAVEVARKISDSVDNAFGEMVHDNLFMNQALRHAAMVAMRSFSWSIGAMRQIGGGTYAAGKAGVLSLKTGENRFSMAHPEFDPRISYAIAFPFVVATISAIYQGLRAGEAPQDWRDLYAPRTGGTVPGLGGKGQVPEHALMPGFQKDVYGWLSHPLREGYAKLGGLPTTALEQITNRDWRGDPIAQRGASPIDQFQQRMAHLFSKLGPIGARAIAKGQPETSGITPVETALGFRAPGVDIQDPTRLEKWMAASAKKEWKAKERHDKTEQRKYARERTYDPQEREQQPQ